MMTHMDTQSRAMEAAEQHLASKGFTVTRESDSLITWVQPDGTTGSIRITPSHVSPVWMGKLSVFSLAKRIFGGK